MQKNVVTFIFLKVSKAKKIYKNIILDSLNFHPPNSVLLICFLTEDPRVNEIKVAERAGLSERITVILPLL